MNKAYIYFSDKNNKNYCGEGGYLLVCEGKIIGTHYCSNRNFANHDLTIWRLEELKENNIDEVISNGIIVWAKDNQEINKETNEKFELANDVYEAKYCNN